MVNPFGLGEPAGAPPEMDILGETYDWETMIEGKVPGLSEAIGIAVRSQATLVGMVLTDDGTHQSAKLIFSQNVNDLLDLLADLQLGRGRAAMRTSRSLIEHAINLHTVTKQLEQAQRYVEHLDQGPALMLELQIGADLLDRKTRGRYLHNLKRVGRGARERFEAARHNWGGSFARSWSNRSLADRATTYRLNELYDLYRLASLVTHGSAGGVLGSVRNHPQRNATYRTGQALELAPVAMFAGLTAYKVALDAVRGVRPDIDIDTYKAGLGPLEAMWPQYFKALTSIDAEVWPDERLRPPGAVLAVSRRGRRRWYLHLPSASMLMPAEEPDLAVWRADQLNELVELITSNPAQYFPDDSDWVTVAVEGVTANPAERGTPIPDTAIMIRPEQLGDDWSPRPIPGLSRPPGE